MTDDRMVDELVAKFTAWVDCVIAMPEGPDKEAELKLLHGWCDRWRDDPFVALIDRIDALAEGPDKEAQQALLDKLNGSKFEKAWKNHLFGMLEEPVEQRRRRPGGGRPRYFDKQDRIDALRDVCRGELRDNPKLITKTHDDLAEHLRPLLKLSRAERGASNRTLLRRIIKPVLDELRTK